MCKIHENLKLWEGSFEYYSGKYFFESQNYTKAYEFFKKAIAFRGNLDYFNDEDPKYLAFYQNPEKLLKK
jgi:hypothetical protein